MKRLWCLLVGLLLLTGCAGGETVDLMSGVEPESSGLGLYIFDGEVITRQFLFQDQEKAIADFRAAKAVPAEVDVTTLQPPYYGLEMGGEELGTIFGVWADGYFITQSGDAYRMDYDFTPLLETYSWQSEKVFDNWAVMPCAFHLARTEAGWNRNFLSPAPEVAEPADVIASLVGQSKKQITVCITNSGEEDWMYGQSFRLEALVEDLWYSIPAEREMAFTAEGLVVPAGSSTEESYDLSAYGKLPAGTYRLVIENSLRMEFEIFD